MRWFFLHLGKPPEYFSCTGKTLDFPSNRAQYVVKSYYIKCTKRLIIVSQNMMN